MSGVNDRILPEEANPHDFDLRTVTWLAEPSAVPGSAAWLAEPSAVPGSAAWQAEPSAFETLPGHESRPRQIAVLIDSVVGDLKP